MPSRTLTAYPTTGNCTDEGTHCLTDGQIRTELSNYIFANKLPTGINPSSGTTPIYFVLTPPGVTVCLQATKGNCSDSSSVNQLCSYHSFTNVNPAKGLGQILYAAQPWTAGNLGSSESPVESGSHCQDGTGVIQEPNQHGLGEDGTYDQGLADLIVNEVAVEHNAIATDPLLNAWHDVASDKDEVTDKCRNDFLGGLLLEPPSITEDKNTKAGQSFNTQYA